MNLPSPSDRRIVRFEHPYRESPARILPQQHPQVLQRRSDLPPATDVLRLDTLGGRVLPEREPIEFGRPIRIRVRLENLGSRPIRVPARREDTSGSLFVLDIERREYDVRAQVVTRQGVVHLPLPVDLELAPRGVVEVPLDLGMQGNDRPLAGFRTYRISGLLRPAILDAGGLIPYLQKEMGDGRSGMHHPR